MNSVSPSGNASAAESPVRNNKRKVRHIAKACDRCRKRKIRCNGEQPCNICSVAKSGCVYENEDKRRTKSELEEVKDRLSKLERLLESHTRMSTVDHTAAGRLRSPVLLPGDSTSVDLALDPLDKNDFATDNPVSSAAEEPFTSNIRNNHITRKPSRYPDLALSSTHFDRLKPTSGDGPPVQYGATSIWTHDTYETPMPAIQDVRRTDLMPGEWVDWGRNLPAILMTCLTKTIHDQAIDHYAAYYASWCMVVNMEGFKKDLIICNIASIHPQRSSPPKWTQNYSPFLHNVVLWLGLFYNREVWPEVYNTFTACFIQHCTELMKPEFEKPPLSALRAVNLFGTCLAQSPMGSHDYGYTYYGMAVAMIQVLGLNINCESYVAQGRMSQAELESRNVVYWAVYMYDLFSTSDPKSHVTPLTSMSTKLRSISAGRPPMVANISTDIPLPAIKAEVDDTPWYHSASSIEQEVKLGHTLNGVKSMKSTVFHWTARLGSLLSKVVHTLYSSKKEPLDRDDVIDEILSDLDTWYNEQPFQLPDILPLPHIILLHVLYHLTRIFLFRPFYRSNSSVSGIQAICSPAEHCNKAAKSILDLLKLYDRYHGLRYGVGTFMNATFTSATIFLLKAAEDQGVPSNLPGTESAKNIEEITYYMSQLAITFNEAGRGLNILQSLRSEWLPTLDDNTTGEHNSSTSQFGTEGFSESDNLDFQTYNNTINGGTNGMTSMGYQNFLTDFPMDESFYNALLSFVGGT